jgi:hypothetical protein
MTTVPRPRFEAMQADRISPGDYVSLGPDIFVVHSIGLLPAGPGRPRRLLQFVLRRIVDGRLSSWGWTYDFAPDFVLNVRQDTAP